METALTRFLYSRYGAVLAVILMTAAAYHAFVSGNTIVIDGDRGLVFPSANEWFTPGFTEMWVNIGVNLLVMVMMVVVNQRYNFIKALTLLYIGMYAFMQLAWPDILVQLYSGSVIAVVVLFCMSLMMDCFDRPGPLTDRKVFMVFVLLSAGSMLQYAYIAYIPVFLIACMQMRVMSFKVLLSAITGIVTPWLIILGSGIIKVENLHMPQIVSMFEAININEWLTFVITLLLTLVLLWTAEILTLFKVLTYNAQRRACNGVVTIVAAVTTVAMIADYTNLAAYIPMLNVCAAFAVSHFFAFHHTSKSYIPILSIYTLYIALYIWKVVI